MKKNTLILAFALLIEVAFSQATKTYLVTFKDKNNSPFSLNRPTEFLSEKSIERRKKQNVALDMSDLPVNASYLNGVKSKGVEVLNQSKWMNAAVVSTTDDTKIDAIKNLSYVKEVQILSSSASVKLPSKYENNNTAINPPAENELLKSINSDYYNYGTSYSQSHQIGVDCLHNLGYHGEGMTIAFLDAGFYKVDSLPAFDSLRVNNQILGTYDFVAHNTSVYEDYTHGMATLSCIGGNMPGQLIGTAPKAKFWLLRTEDAYSETLQEETNWLMGAEFADSVGVDVINSSLGYSLFDGGIGNHTYADMNGHTTIVSKAAEWAARKGIFVNSSAGNSAGPPWFKITAPADADSILTVGAVDSTGNTASFSSRGPSYDGRVKPNTAARGWAAVVESPFGYIEWQSGTSFSSPITAGAVTCLWQAHPTATNLQLITAIQQSASQYFFPDSLQGYGIPNFCIASAILTDILGVDNMSNEYEQLLVFPNPTSATFSVSFYSNKKQSAKITLTDISGREIWSEVKSVYEKNNFFQIPDIGISSGLYILNLTTAEKTYFKKLVKE